MRLAWTRFLIINRNNSSKKREQIIDAALECLRHWGVEKINMSDVAKQAGVVRTTIYNNFPQKQDLLQAAFLRVIQSFFDKLTTYIEPYQSTEERFLQAALYILIEMPNDPILNVILAPDMAHKIHQSAIASAESRVLREELVRRIVRDDPNYAGKISELAKIAGLTTLSLLLFDSAIDKTNAGRRQMLEAWLLPVVRHFAASVTGP